MPVIVPGGTFVVVDAGVSAPNIIPQTDSLQAVVADDDIAVIAGNTNTPLALGTSDFAVVTLETTVVL